MYYHSKNSTLDFEKFYAEEHRQVFAYALKHLRDRELAADHVQECFIKLWKQWDKINTESNPRSYLYSISKHLLFDEFKKQVQFQRYSNYCSSSQQDSCNSNEESLAYNELEDMYREAIVQLPEKRQHIFRLSKQGQLSNSEIAHQLNISVNTVRDQLVKGNKQIKAYITLRHSFIAKKIFSFLIVFSSLHVVYVNKEPLLTTWKKIDSKPYTTNT